MMQRRIRRGVRLTITVGMAASVVLLAGCAQTDMTRTSGVSSSSTPTSKESSVPESVSNAVTTELFDAAQSNDAVKAQTVLDRGASLTAQNADGRTALVVATKAGATEVAILLLNAGADPNTKDHMQDSAYLYAGAEGLDEILRATLAHGADVNSTNRYGGTALIPASEHAHLSTIRILIDAGVPLDHINNLGWTALHEAIVLGDGGQPHIDTVRMLIEAGADVRIADKDGTSPRVLAADRGYTEIVKLIDAARG